MEAKYHMTREENIFVVKRNIIDYIWKSAKLEWLAVTYQDTEAIYNGMGVQGVKVSDIVAVNNLKHAWQFVLDTLDYPTDWALTMMLYLVRKQMSLDGNKRTSMLAGNHVMILKECGIISIPIELQPTFTKMRIEFYKSNDMGEIKQFLYENCIDGIVFEPLPGQEPLEEPER